MSERQKYANLIWFNGFTEELRCGNLTITLGIDFAPIEWPLQPLTEKVRNSQCSFIILLTFWFLSKHECKLLFIIKVLYWSVTTNFEAPNDLISFKSHGDLTSLIDQNCLFDLKKLKMFKIQIIMMKKINFCNPFDLNDLGGLNNLTGLSGLKLKISSGNTKNWMTRVMMTWLGLFL